MHIMSCKKENIDLLYNNVTDKQENEIDFKMDTRNISGNTKELKYYKCIFSPSVICVYTCDWISNGCI